MTGIVGNDNESVYKRRGGNEDVRIFDEFSLPAQFIIYIRSLFRDKGVDGNDMTLGT